MIDGSMSMLMTPKGIYCARDRTGQNAGADRQKEEGYCAHLNPLPI